jgi:hypothetical protein
MDKLHNATSFWFIAIFLVGETRTQGPWLQQGFQRRRLCRSGTWLEAVVPARSLGKLGSTMTR